MMKHEDTRNLESNKNNMVEDHISHFAISVNYIDLSQKKSPNIRGQPWSYTPSGFSLGGSYYLADHLINL